MLKIPLMHLGLLLLGLHKMGYTSCILEKLPLHVCIFTIMTRDMHVVRALGNGHVSLASLMLLKKHNMVECPPHLEGGYF